MRDFVRRMATQGPLATRGVAGAHDVPLQTVARNLHEDQEDFMRRRHAVAELEQLANDLATYGQVARGACIP